MTRYIVNKCTSEMLCWSYYKLVPGVYKPRVRCYDVSQLSMKFERCMDSEVVKLVTLNTDYSKVGVTVTELTK